MRWSARGVRRRSLMPEWFAPMLARLDDAYSAVDGAPQTLWPRSVCSLRLQNMMTRNARRLPVPCQRSPRRWIVALARVDDSREDKPVQETDTTKRRSLLATFTDS